VQTAATLKVAADESTIAATFESPLFRLEKLGAIAVARFLNFLDEKFRKPRLFSPNPQNTKIPNTHLPHHSHTLSLSLSPSLGARLSLSLSLSLSSLSLTFLEECGTWKLLLVIERFKRQSYLVSVFFFVSFFLCKFNL
jgi:hypothetical protein